MSEAVLPPAGPTYARCETCRHWQPLPGGIPKYDVGKATMVVVVAGECRALPPVADMKWPKSRATDHCGSHAKAGSEAVIEDAGKTARKVAKRGEAPAAAPLLPEMAGKGVAS